MIDELFSTKTLRDARAADLKRQGLAVKRYRTGPAQLHPMYVEDQKQTDAGRDTGFGNTVYKTFWPKLYGVKEIIR